MFRRRDNRVWQTLYLRRLCSRFDTRSSICDACAADAAPATPVRSSICDACAADLPPEAAFATLVQQICCQNQHLRCLCSRFAAGRSICDACKQHLRRLCSRFDARCSICDACAADSASAMSVRSSICDACAPDLLLEAAFATLVQQI